MEAELQCSNGIQSMERKLRIACHASDANIDNVLKLHRKAQKILTGFSPETGQLEITCQNKYCRAAI
ncbi:unnamed protein product [Prunus armeniaca]|uniref:Uncharacterized protein n=1 Tax=Prunus armeniaca TaxID=36596 RepID=A0A6J5XMW1_PRUAR|nr:unnamed protein product [Prunus armeniaca]